MILVKERDQFWDRYNLEEKRTALFCFLYIISTSSSSLLLQWWSQSDLASLESFFGLLCRALLTFEYRGRAHVISMARDFTSMKREWNKKKLFSFDLLIGMLFFYFVFTSLALETTADKSCCKNCIRCRAIQAVCSNFGA